MGLVCHIIVFTALDIMVLDVQTVIRPAKVAIMKALLQLRVVFVKMDILKYLEIVSMLIVVQDFGRMFLDYVQVAMRHVQPVKTRRII